MQSKYSFIISIISFISIIIFFIFLEKDYLSGKDCTCSNVISQNTFFIFILLIIIFSISLFYYLHSLSLTKKNKIIFSNQNTIYSILSFEEKSFLSYIIEKNGRIEQLVLAKKYGKIKAHRLIKKLKEKNIVLVKKENNKNIIFLNKELELLM
ncbi:hypothetical protein GW835_01795 [archaeon]|nr:hypothetical protein [archaeon]NCP79282.1 hypothetical protein [archaeon]NCP98259.1 hypothetical protein [archaeon]NCQ07049.1 hypothetical protein [archaeon]NCQ50845.1 hypothetical protein [archaeon]